jgi:thiamine biosynthesis lipoprotein
MSKTFTDLRRHALHGPTMGSRWSALFHMPPQFDEKPVLAAMAEAMAEVDAQMSTWKPDSDLMRLNAETPNVWVDVPVDLMTVLDAALQVGRASEGAFDIGVGDAVSAWGFGSGAANEAAIRTALGLTRHPAHQKLELDFGLGRVRKHAPLMLDLSGIAKGYGVDRLTEVALGFGITAALVAIDGELRATGLQPDGTAWTVAVERPDHAARAPHAIMELHDAAIATSGDYRHWVTVGDRRLAHTIDPLRGGPLAASPASVTVVAETCMMADAWATALMVRGSLDGAILARKHALNALFIDRDGNQLLQTRVGRLFAPRAHLGRLASAATCAR